MYIHNFVHQTVPAHHHINIAGIDDGGGQLSVQVHLARGKVCYSKITSLIRSVRKMLHAHMHVPRCVSICMLVLFGWGAVSLGCFFSSSTTI